MSSKDIDEYEIIQIDKNQYIARKKTTKYDAKDMPVAPQVNTPKHKKQDRLEAILDRLESLYGVKFNRVTTKDLIQGDFNSLI
jgi:hypothetical protein